MDMSSHLQSLCLKRREIFGKGRWAECFRKLPVSDYLPVVKKKKIWCKVFKRTLALVGEKMNCLLRATLDRCGQWFGEPSLAQTSEHCASWRSGNFSYLGPQIVISFKREGGDVIIHNGNCLVFPRSCVCARVRNAVLASIMAICPPCGLSDRCRVTGETGKILPVVIMQLFECTVQRERSHFQTC